MDCKIFAMLTLMVVLTTGNNQVLSLAGNNNCTNNCITCTPIQFPSGSTIYPDITSSCTSCSIGYNLANITVMYNYTVPYNYSNVTISGNLSAQICSPESCTPNCISCSPISFPSGSTISPNITSSCTVCNSGYNLVNSTVNFNFSVANEPITDQVSVLTCSSCSSNCNTCTPLTFPANSSISPNITSSCNACNPGYNFENTSITFSFSIDGQTFTDSIAVQTCSSCNSNCNTCIPLIFPPNSNIYPYITSSCTACNSGSNLQSTNVVFNYTVGNTTFTDSLIAYTCSGNNSSANSQIGVGQFQQHLNSLFQSSSNTTLNGTTNLSSGSEHLIAHTLIFLSFMVSYLL